MLGCSEVSVRCGPQGAGSYIRRQLRWVWVCWDVVRCVWCSPQGAGSYIRRQLRWVWVCWDVVRCPCGAVLRVRGLILDDS